jgi:hypothetical protein
MTNTYKNCPFSGVVCMICKYPVSSVKTTPLLKLLYDHENKREVHKNYPTLSSMNEAQPVKMKFWDEMNVLADLVIANLVNVQDARNIYCTYLKRDNFPYCKECKTLVLTQST